MEQAMRYFLWIFFFSTALLRADTNTFSSSRVNSFYDTFVCEEKDDVAFIDLTGPCTSSSSNSGGPFTPPPPLNGHFPIFIVNNTKYADSRIYFLIYGQGVSASGAYDSGQSYVDVVNHVLVPATGAGTPNSALYSYQLSTITKTNGHYVIYVPYLNSGIMLFGIKSSSHAAPFTGLSAGSGLITNPIPVTDAADNYYTAFNFGEITFLPPGLGLNQFTADYSCVSYYSLSFTLGLYKNGASPQLTGNAYSRSHNIGALQSAFSGATPAYTATQWNQLISADNFDDGLPIRVLSANIGMSNSLLPTNYFSNTSISPSGVGSWAQNSWTASGSYYDKTSIPQNHYVTLNIVVSGTQETYTGFSDPANSYGVSNTPFVFQRSDSNLWFFIPFNDSVFSPTTSSCIFATPAVFTNMYYSTDRYAANPIAVPSSGQYYLRAVEITKEFAASINSGILPIKNYSVTESGPSNSYVQNYYWNNPNLTTARGGAWYNLFSKALIKPYQAQVNTFYTYTYDDYLYRQATGFDVTVAHNVVNASTYMVVTLQP